MQTRFELRLAIAAAIAALSIGCGKTETERTAQPSAPPAAASTNQIDPQPRDALRDGGTFTFPLDEMPANFNYGQVDGTGQNGAYVLGALLPTTYTTDAQGRPMWNPNYLASEPTLTSSPKQVVTYKLNPKAIWYDGSPITWQDFYWQWKAQNGTDKRYQISSANGFENIENVERGANDHEVIVTFKRPYADWQGIFYFWLPPSANKDPQAFNTSWKDKPLSTAGPFKLDSLNQTTKTITLVRNEKWWGQPAKLDSIVYRFIEHDAQIDALANSEIDAMDIGPDVNTYNRALSIEDVQIRVAGGPNFRHLTINGTSPNLQDVNVRRAIAMGIDRPTIARALLGPLGVEAKPLDNHIYMRNQDGYKDNSDDVGIYNPDQAKELLDAAGWKVDGNARKKDGKTLTVNIVIPSGVVASRQESELIQNMLARINVTVNIDTVPTSDFFAKYVIPGQFDMTIFSWMGTAYPVASKKSVYAKPQPGPNGGLNVQQNYARVGSDQIDGLFNQATEELDRDKAKQMGNDIDSLLWKEVHSLTLYQRPELVATRSRLGNFGAFGFADPWVYENIGWKK
ncbi:MAG TPA: ABC transporter family substrate-binding protein [Vicinamibacterales bacterium]|nr:ABC transporter family substrate-binding protein [Vicinamibacterales bacterium]